MIKNCYQRGNSGNISQHNKGHLLKPTAYIMLNGEKLRAFLLKSRARQGCPLSPHLLIIVLEVLSTTIRQEKEVKGIQIGR